MNKSKQTALILSIFGLHYFYLNKIGLGILYWFTGFGWLIWWIADIIRFATMSEEEFNAKYNTPYSAFVAKPIENTNNNTNIVNVGNQDNAAQLKTYNELYEKGVLTEEEFNAKKKQLLNM